jgi:hypothetical protein
MHHPTSRITTVLGTDATHAGAFGNFGPSISSSRNSTLVCLAPSVLTLDCISVLPEKKRFGNMSGSVIEERLAGLGHYLQVDTCEGTGSGRYAEGGDT